MLHLAIMVGWQLRESMQDVGKARSVKKATCLNVLVVGLVGFDWLVGIIFCNFLTSLSFL